MGFCSFRPQHFFKTPSVSFFPLPVLAECTVDFFPSTVRQASDPSFSPFMPPLCVGRDNSVSIATRYELDDPGIESP